MEMDSISYSFKGGQLWMWKRDLWFAKLSKIFYLVRARIVGLGCSLVVENLLACVKPWVPSPTPHTCAHLLTKEDENQSTKKSKTKLKNEDWKYSSCLLGMHRTWV
jgi:hypothetical protein